MMCTKKALPFHPDFENANAYVVSLLHFVTSSELAQKLCGGVHILDFMTLEPELYTTVLPQEWRAWFFSHDISNILDLLLREEVDQWMSSLNPHTIGNTSNLNSWHNDAAPPASLLKYIQDIRAHSLDRSYDTANLERSQSDSSDSKILPRNITVGMKPKKVHEVNHFARYIASLTSDIADRSTCQITHIVDFGSGQNYLGRALASPPYNKHIIAIESKHLNIDGAKSMDVTAKLVEKQKPMRNKKHFRMGSSPLNDSAIINVVSLDNTRLSTANVTAGAKLQKQGLDFQLSPPRSASEGPHGMVQYTEHTIEDGNILPVIESMRSPKDKSEERDPQFLVISLHSCGNLLHHGLRSLILNPSVKAVAMVGCCYNLVTERLGPPTYKLPSLRASHPRLDRTSSVCDPHGFPMSERLATYKHRYGEGIRLNITARMMAVQAPQNWTAAESEAFFTRHYYRALLQRIFVDRGIVEKPKASEGLDDDGSPKVRSGFSQPITVGSLRKVCYTSFTAYVRGAVAKLAKDNVRGTEIVKLMAGLTDEDIAWYHDRYQSKKKELSIMWSLMAFSAGVVESVIVVDRWLYLREQAEVKDCWVETVFEYKQSPRNLVVVGIKK